MSEVHVKENESLDSALKRFKRSCAKAGVLAEVRRREHYESPSVKRRCLTTAALLRPALCNYFSQKRTYSVNRTVTPRLRARSARPLPPSSVVQVPVTSLSIFRNPASTVSS